MCNIRDHQVGQLTEGEGDGDGENFKIENFFEHEMTLCQHVQKAIKTTEISFEC